MIAGQTTYECEYRGSFSSGRIVGPVRNGALCRSEPGDRLEAIQLFIVPRSATDSPGAPTSVNGLPPTDEARAVETRAPPSTRPTGPRFSVFRDVVE